MRKSNDEGFNLLNQNNPLLNKKEKKLSEEQKLQKKKEQEEREQIRKKFICDLCLGMLKDPLMCKKCKKYGCAECMKRTYDAKGICGLCKNVVYENDFIDMKNVLGEFSDYFIKNIENKDKNEMINKKKIKEIQELDKQLNDLNKEEDDKIEEVDGNNNDAPAFDINNNNFINDNNIMENIGPNIPQNININDNIINPNINDNDFNVVNNEGILQVNVSSPPNLVFSSKISIDQISQDNKAEHCPRHKEKLLDYLCLNCSVQLCESCLSIMEAASKIHEDHLIMKKSQIIDYNIQDIFSEEKKLPLTQQRIDKLCQKLQRKLRILEIEKKQGLAYVEEMKKKFEEKCQRNITSVKKIMSDLNDKISDITSLKKSIPNEIKTFIEQGSQELKNNLMNKIHTMNDSNYDKIIGETEPISNKSKMFFDLIKSEEVTMIIPDETNECEIINQKIKFPDDSEYTYELKVNCLLDTTYLTLMIGSENNSVHENNFNCFFVMRDCNDVSQYIGNNVNYPEGNKRVLNAEFDTTKFVAFKDGNSQIPIRVYVNKIVIK